MTSHNQENATVIAVFPNKVKIAVDNIDEFINVSGEKNITIGSYLEISDNDNAKLIAIIENYSIEIKESDTRVKQYIIEAMPLGVISNGVFYRGGDNIAIPPKIAKVASQDDIKKIYEHDLFESKKFVFAKLANLGIPIPVDGNKFFNKHIALVGSTGSGKSHTVTKIIQEATNSHITTGYNELNNSHIVIFDIHSEYKNAFETKKSNYIDIDKLILPYWLLNSEELEDILLDTGERDNYNQSSLFRTLVTLNKIKHNKEIKKIFYDSPVFFNINEVLRALTNLKNETVNAKNSNRIMINDGSYNLESDGKVKDDTTGVNFSSDSEKYTHYFEAEYTFFCTKPQSITKGDYADGSIDKFINRIRSKIGQDRLSFLFGENVKNVTLGNVLEVLISYEETQKKNITIIDLSGVPFEVLNITVSLIARLLFDVVFYRKKLLNNTDVPLLLVFEEAHKYVPKSDLTKFRSSTLSIERIMKEGRKYGITAMIVSQRPSEVSETVFSQCGNFVAMRLTNPTDQNYVQRILPDSFSSLIESLPSLKQGEALLIGEAIAIPSIVKIDRCEPEPSSSDIPYLEIWRNVWKDASLDDLVEKIIY